MADQLPHGYVRQCCASWLSEANYVFAARLQEVGSRYWLRARAQAVIDHDRALRMFDELAIKRASTKEQNNG